MNRSLIAAALAAALVPTVAAADPGGYDKNFYQNLERNYQVMRDGTIDQMRREGQENVEAFQRLREQQNFVPRSEYARQPRRR
jgi:hypothetical protein